MLGDPGFGSPLHKYVQHSTRPSYPRIKNAPRNDDILEMQMNLTEDQVGNKAPVELFAPPQMNESFSVKKRYVLKDLASILLQKSLRTIFLHR